MIKILINSEMLTCTEEFHCGHSDVDKLKILTPHHFNLLIFYLCDPNLKNISRVKLIYRFNRLPLRAEQLNTSLIRLKPFEKVAPHTQIL